MFEAGFISGCFALFCSRRFAMALIGGLVLGQGSVSVGAGEFGSIEGHVNVSIGNRTVPAREFTITVTDLETMEEVGGTWSASSFFFQVHDLPPGQYRVTAEALPIGSGSADITIEAGKATPVEIQLMFPDDAATPSNFCSVGQSEGSVNYSCSSDAPLSAVVISPAHPSNGYAAPFSPSPFLPQLGGRLQEGEPNQTGSVRMCGESRSNNNPGLLGLPAVEFPLIPVTTNQGYGDFFLNNDFDFNLDPPFELVDQILTVTLPQTQLQGPLQTFLSIGKAQTNSLTLEVPILDMTASATVSDPPSPAGSSDSRVLLNNLVLLNHSQVLPHTPFGRIGGLSLLTQIVVSNSSLNEGSGLLQFWNQEGEELDVTIDTVTSNQHSFNVAAASSRTFVLDPGQPGSVQIGWGLGSGEGLSFSTVFSTTVTEPGSSAQGEEEDRLLGEAGIAGSGVSTFHVLGVSKNTSGFDTGVAIANPGGAPTVLVLTLKDTQEAVVAQSVIGLASRGQTSGFVQDFFDVEWESFSGTLIIASPSDVSVISIRTLEGIQRSSL